jgi:hypothetical protein
MQSSGSQATSSSGESTHTAANLIGTAIAVVTLLAPLLVIAHYSPETPTNLPPPTEINKP